MSQIFFCFYYRNGLTSPNKYNRNKFLKIKNIILSLSENCAGGEKSSMKELKCQLQVIANTISLLSKQFELVANKMENLESLYQKKAFTGTPMVSSEPSITTREPPSVVNETPDHASMENEYTQTREANTSSVPAKGNSEIPSNIPVLSTVLDVIRRSRKGIDIAQIKKKTNFSSRQISNALYKLSRVQGKIEAQSRGVYVMKRNNK
jgi:hypothetical protein